jgi:serine/threonine protein kinase
MVAEHSFVVENVISVRRPVLGGGMRDRQNIECRVCLAVVRERGDVDRHDYVCAECRLAGRTMADAARTKGTDDSSADTADYAIAGQRARRDEWKLPRVVGGYTVHEVAGRGAFGTVYRATGNKSGREVAIKVPREAALEGEGHARFLREAKLAGTLRHPGIVRVHGVGEADGLPFLVSEFVRGETLRRRLERGIPPFRDSVKWMIALCRSVQAAHAAGVLHRDIKPENILLAEGGVPRLMDFGLAKSLVAEGSVLTQDSSVLGTPAYMSPEQARGEVRALTAATDQYSLGAVFYHLLTGHPPFEGPAFAVVAAVIHGAPEPIETLNPLAPAELVRHCGRLMDKDPGKRVGNLEEMAVELEEWLKRNRKVLKPGLDKGVEQAVRVLDSTPARVTSFGVMWLFKAAVFTFCTFVICSVGYMLALMFYDMFLR